MKKGNKKVKIFSKEKFIKVEGRKPYDVLGKMGIPEKYRWQTVCDGKEVIDGKCEGYFILDDWCVEIENKKGEEKKMTIKDFIEKNIVIAFTTPEQIETFAEMIKPYKLKTTKSNKDAEKWAREGKNYMFKMSNGEKVYFTYNFPGDHGIAWMPENLYKVLRVFEKSYENEGWKVVPFAEFAQDEKNSPMDYLITIKWDGKKVTTADMIVNGKVVNCGKARLNPEDKFDFAKGARLAFDRLFTVGRKPEWKRVKRIAKIGDTIEIIDDSESRGCYKKGDVFKVSYADDAGVGVKIGRDEEYIRWKPELPNTAFLTDNEYVVLE